MHIIGFTNTADNNLWLIYSTKQTTIVFNRREVFYFFFFFKYFKLNIQILFQNIFLLCICILDYEKKFYTIQFYGLIYKYI